jgi:hypothetical protein
MQGTAQGSISEGERVVMEIVCCTVEQNPSPVKVTASTKLTNHANDPCLLAVVPVCQLFESLLPDKHATMTDFTVAANQRQ